MTLADLHADALYPVGVVADVLGICPDSVYGMIQRQLIAVIRVGPRLGRIKVRGSAIIEYAEKRAA